MSKEKHSDHTSSKALQERKSFLYDENRKDAVQKRHAAKKLMIREHINLLAENGTFLEYGGLAIAAQRGRKSIEKLMAQTPADGLVCGIVSIDPIEGKITPAQFMVLGYDYTVMAGTQGAFNHKKTDRMLAIAADQNLPILFYLEGGGGRPGDVDFYPISVGGLDIPTFTRFAALEHKVPRIGIVTGYCFAGNAALAGCCDLLIATPDSSIGMGGPAMIEGGGLGIVDAKEIGPSTTMMQNGTIDILANDDRHATVLSLQCLNLIRQKKIAWKAHDQHIIQTLIPEDRRWAYDIHKVIDHLTDIDSVIYTKTEYGKSITTCFVRIEGKAYGLMANNCKHLGGAIDAEAADKMTGFIEQCDKFRLPLISLCDAPGFMVGPECEDTGMVKQAAKLFTAGAKFSGKLICIVLRKAYGLGAMAMAGGSLHRPLATLSWPTGEFGAMGLEGAVKLAYRNELAAAANEEEKAKLYYRLVNQLYEQGKALNAAAVLEIDDVIYPHETRTWITKLIG